MRGSFLKVLALFVASALPVPAQFHDRELTVERCGPIFMPVNNPANAVHEPFTTKYVVSSQLLQKDGTTKAVETTVVDAYDSQGRWMNSKTVAPSPEEESPSTHFCVYDPVAGIRTTWTVPGKEATRMGIAEIESSHSACAKERKFEDEVLRSKPLVEDLGTQTIQGYVAHGIRTSRSIPIRADENNSTIVRSVEVWRAPVPGMSFLAGLELTDTPRLDDPWYWNKQEKLGFFGLKLPELFATASGRTGLLVREVTEDPRFGRRSEEVQDYRQGNPDPYLFQPPEDYKIVTKKATPAVCPLEEAATPTQSRSSHTP